MCLSTQASFASKGETNISVSINVFILLNILLIACLTTNVMHHSYSATKASIIRRFATIKILDIFKIFIKPIHTSILLVQIALHENGTGGHKTRMHIFWRECQ